ncbi:MAG TPA: sigma-70 family RNA polymerase sigma factor [Gemmataceae bacterium]|nr:sigma-70 family RNA polymerase sigma factor [Gemmataceae bacterium]
MDVADLAQLGRLFEEHRPKLLAMVRRRSDRRLAARRDPEDILNEAFLKAQAGWEAFKQSAMKPYPWLYRIVLNHLYDDHDFNNRAKRDRRAEVAWPDDSSMQLAMKLMSPLTSPSKAAAHEEYLAELRQCMARMMEIMKPEDYEILCMRFCDELSGEEIALVLDIDAQAARQRLTRARRRFVNLWVKLFGQEGLQL